MRSAPAMSAIRSLDRAGGALEASIASATRRAAGVPAARRPSGCSSSKPTAPSPPNTCCCATTSASPSTPSSKRKIAQLSAPHSGRAWRLAAGARRRVRHERQRESLFRAEDDRRLPSTRRTWRARARRSARAAARSTATSSRASCCRCSACTTWRSVPVLPVEIMLLPTLVAVPSQQDFLLGAHHDRAADGAGGAEAARARIRAASASTNCFCRTPHSDRHHRARRRIRAGAGSRLFACSTGCCASSSRCFRRSCAQRAIERAVAFVEERLNGEDGLGAIYPPMANTVMMYEALGNAADYPPRAITRRGIDKLLVIGERRGLLPALRLADLGHRADRSCPAGSRRRERTPAPAKQGLDWLLPKQVLDVKGDWAAKRPDVRPGGWAFQYNNAHYPDLDDTAVVVMAMDRARRADRQPATTTWRSRAAANGSWACRAATAAGRRSTSTISNTISTTSRSPIMARCSIRRPRMSPRAASRCWRSSARPSQTSKALADGVDYLRRTQLPEGSWYGRWGLNYIYGTWSVLCALNAAGVDHQDPDDAQGGGLAAVDPEQRWRLGRGRRQLPARLSSGYRACADHGVANGMGLACADGGGRGRSPGGRARRWST